MRRVEPLLSRSLSGESLNENVNSVQQQPRSELFSLLSAQSNATPASVAPTSSTPLRREVPAISGPITEGELHQLMGTIKQYIPPVEFRPDVEDLLKDYVRSSWPRRKGQKPLSQLIIEMQHPCTEEWFTQYDLNERIHKIKDELEQSEVALAEAQRKSDTHHIAVYDRSVQDLNSSLITRIEETGKFFTEGIFSHFENNLLFGEDGRPIGSSDGRFGKCNEVLRKQKAARNAIRRPSAAAAPALSNIAPFTGKNKPGVPNYATMYRISDNKVREEFKQQRRAEYQQELARKEITRRDTEAQSEVQSEVLAEIPTSYLPAPKRGMFGTSPDPVTTLYTTTVMPLLKEKLKTHIKTDLTKFETYENEMQTACFKELLLNKLGALLQSKKKVPADALVTILNTQVQILVQAITGGVIPLIKENIEFIKDIPVRFLGAAGAAFPTCETSFQNLPVLLERLNNLKFTYASMEDIVRYRSLLDVIRRWDSSNYGKVGFMKSAIDAVALNLTRRENELRKSVAATPNISAQVDSNIEEIMNALQALVPADAEIRRSYFTTDRYKGVDIGIGEEIANLLRVKPVSLADVLKNIAYPCFQAYFADLLNTFKGLKHENRNKPLVNPVITRIQTILAPVVVNGFVESFRDKLTFKNNAPTGFSSAEFKRKYPTCHALLQKRYADSEKIGNAGYYVLPSVSLLYKSPAQKVYNQNLPNIIAKLNEILPMTYNINEYLNAIKEADFKTRLIDLLGRLGNTIVEKDIITIGRALIGNYTPGSNTIVLYPPPIAAKAAASEATVTDEALQMVNSSPNGFEEIGISNFDPHAYAGRKVSVNNGAGVGPLYNLYGGRSRSNKMGSKGRENVTRRGRRAYNILRSPRTLSSYRSKKNRSRTARRTRRRSSATSVTAF
jgi:hypothetical protein